MFFAFGNYSHICSSVAATYEFFLYFLSYVVLSSDAQVRQPPVGQLSRLSRLLVSWP